MKFFQKLFKIKPISSSTIAYNTTRRELANYSILVFLSTLKKYTLTDISVLQKVAKINEWRDIMRKRKYKGSGRCSTAIASLCFAIIEQVGMVLRTDLINPNNPQDTSSARRALKTGNSKNAESFFSYALQQNIITTNNDFLKAIYILFRNPVTHNLFPAHNLGVSQDSHNGLTNLVCTIDGSNSLNINCLVLVISQTIECLETDVTNQANYHWVSTINDTLSLLRRAEEENLRNQYSDFNLNNEYPGLQTELRQLLPNFRF